jgi:hypothetical protein
MESPIFMLDLAENLGASLELKKSAIGLRIEHRVSLAELFFLKAENLKFSLIAVY